MTYFGTNDVIHFNCCKSVNLFFLYYFTVGGNKNVIDLSEIGSALVAVVKNHDKFTKDTIIIITYKVGEKRYKIPSE